MTDEPEATVATMPIIQAAEAVAATIANPSLPVLAEDLVMVHSLVNEVKTRLDGKHPSLSAIFHALFNIG
jgi:hypothetical protein